MENLNTYLLDLHHNIRYFQINHYTRREFYNNDYHGIICN